MKKGKWKCGFCKKDFEEGKQYAEAEIKELTGKSSFGFFVCRECYLKEFFG